jgi:hypothetical protein
LDSAAADADSYFGVIHAAALRLGGRKPGTLFAGVGCSPYQGKEVAVLVDKELRVPEDTSQVTLDQDWEVRYWCERFNVDEDALRACVVEVGPRTDDVERRLRDVAKQSFYNDGED